MPTFFKNKDSFQFSVELHNFLQNWNEFSFIILLMPFWTIVGDSVNMFKCVIEAVWKISFSLQTVIILDCKVL